MKGEAEPREKGLVLHTVLILPCTLPLHMCNFLLFYTINQVAILPGITSRSCTVKCVFALQKCICWCFSHICNLFNKSQVNSWNGAIPCTICYRLPCSTLYSKQPGRSLPQHGGEQEFISYAEGLGVGGWETLTFNLCLPQRCGKGLESSKLCEMWHIYDYSNLMWSHKSQIHIKHNPTLKMGWHKSLVLVRHVKDLLSSWETGTLWVPPHCILDQVSLADWGWHREQGVGRAEGRQIRQGNGGPVGGLPREGVGTDLWHSGWILIPSLDPVGLAQAAWICWHIFK